MITTTPQKQVVAAALHRYLQAVNEPEGPLFECVELMLLAPAARRAALLPFVQAILDERQGGKNALPALRASEDARVQAEIDVAQSAVDNL